MKKDEQSRKQWFILPVNFLAPTLQGGSSSLVKRNNPANLYCGFMRRMNTLASESNDMHRHTWAPHGSSFKSHHMEAALGLNGGEAPNNTMQLGISLLLPLGEKEVYLKDRKAWVIPD